ncbi:MAG: tetratricopeptide repeat protein [Rhodocyclaceae bacterium]|nr:tetratricopeptide repeat protein [Rhodocyclaceae bacterium]
MKNPSLWSAGALLALLTLTGTALASPAEIQSLVRAGQFDQALAMTDADLAEKPKDPDLRFLRGVALTELGRQDEAIEVFQALTSDFPELPEPYNNLAVIYAQQKAFDKARAALEMAIRTHPSYATAHENLGDIYSRLASDAYSKALQLDAGNAAAQTKLAMVRQLISSNGAVAPTPVAASPIAAAPVTAATAPLPDATMPAPVAPSAEARDVEARVLAWADAWSNKDVDAYLSFYAPDFVVPGGRSRSAWENERRARVGKPGKIRVTLENVEVSLDGDKARVRFRQHYDSYNFDASADKTLEMVRHGGDWAIRREVVGG